MEEEYFLVLFFSIYTFECGCAILSRRYGWQGSLSRLWNSVAKIQTAFPFFQQTWLCKCKCKCNLMGVQELSASPSASFPAIWQMTGLAVCDKEGVSFLLVGAVTSRTCTQPCSAFALPRLLLIWSLNQTLIVSTVQSCVAASSFSHFYLLVVSTAKPLQWSSTFLSFPTN